MSERKDIIRTRRAIWQAYLQLSKKKAYTDITASDVIKNAKVSRGTFYGHYRDIGELREEIEQDFCAMTSQALLPAVQNLFQNTERACFHILRFFEKNRDMILSVTASGTCETYFHRCKDAMAQDILRCAYTGECNEKAALKCDMMASLVVDQGRDVVMGEGNYDITFRSAAICEVIRNGIPSGDIK